MPLPPYIRSSAILIVPISLIITFSCNLPSKREERIAVEYCGSCHLFPKPSLLNKETWEKSVLPQMAFRMGFHDIEITDKISNDDLAIVLRSIPQRPIISQQDWETVWHYYLRNSPDSLIWNPIIISDTITQFNPSHIRTIKRPVITLLHSDTLRYRIYAGTRHSTLFELDNSFQMLDSMFVGSPPSHVQVGENNLFVTTMGIMDPNDQSKGQLIRIKEDNSMEVLIDSLQRPVYFEKADLDGDGEDEFIVCSFGNYTGDLGVFKNHKGRFEKTVLNSSPGARKVIVKDVDGDGMPDIIALMTQGDERIVLYRNKGNLSFEEKVLLRFPPVYGSSFIEINDFNGDGHFDILYTNGDNADYSMIVKPYHAVRIFENDGRNNFHEAWSFSMPGASMAMARDFDGDGDLDIAAVSFFPDFERTPERSFVYFENKGGYHFTPQITPMATKGRWLVMEVGDFDQDGDEDILLGATNFIGSGASSEVYEKWMSDITPLLLLENIGSRRLP